TFASSNGTDDWRNGKLWKANRYHYDVSTSPEEPPGALIFADGFESGDTSPSLPPPIPIFPPGPRRVW
ncbi:MAG: hypothetical protein GY856_50935, partial [bacterium]|nr:hypothetical protein [bacterium]